MQSTFMMPVDIRS